MVRTLGLVAVVLLTGATRSQGQEAHTLKIRKPAVGETYLVEKRDEDQQDQKLTDAKGKVLKQASSARKDHFIYRESVLEHPPGQPRPTQLRRQYEKAVSTLGERTTTLPYEGKSLLIEKKDGRYRFRIEGGEELTGAAAQRLDEEFNRPKPDFLAILLPKKAVQVNEKWDLDLKALAAMVQKDDKEPPLGLDVARGTGAAKLLRVYQKDGRLFGVIELTIELPITSLPVGPGKRLPVEAGSKMTLRATMDGCIDGGTADGAIDGRAEVVVTFPDRLEDGSPARAIIVQRSGGVGTQRKVTK